MLKELFTASQLATTGQITTKLSDNKDVKSAEWYNFTNQTWEVRDAATKILLDIILPYTHVVRNMDYPQAIEIDNKNYQYLAPTVMDVNGNAGTPFFLYNLYLCQQAEVQEAFTLPYSNKLLLDPASGFYPAYGLGNVYLAHTSKLVKITSRIPWGMTLTIQPKVIDNGQYVGVTTSNVLYLKSGEEMVIEGNFNQLVFGGANDGLSTIGQPFQTLVGVQILAFYDPANEGLPPLDNLIPSQASGDPGLELASVYLANSGHQFLHNYSVPVGTTTMANIGTANALVTSFLGNQRSQVLAVNCTETYNLWAYPCLDNYATQIGAKGIQIATTAPATAYSPAFPTTSADGSQSNTNASTPYDLYDLGALVGIYPGYQIVIENTGAAAATVTMEELHYNNPIQ